MKFQLTRMDIHRDFDQDQSIHVDRFCAWAWASLAVV